MEKARTSLVQGILVLALGFAAGCGGSNGYEPAAPVTSVPKAVGLQPGTALDPTPGQISNDVAVKGPVVYVGTDQNLLNVAWVGSHKFYLRTDIAQAALSGANFDYAFGSSSAGSFVWRYRTNEPALSLAGDGISAVAKAADLFFDVETDASSGDQTAYVLTVQGKKVSRVPYNLPSVDFTQNGISGIAISGTGVGLLNVYSLSDFALRGPRNQAARQRDAAKQWLSLRRQPIDKQIAAFKARLKPETSGSTSSGYYFVTTTAQPVPLALPTGSLGIQVNAINASGVAVGESYTGDPSNPNVVPYYWTPNGSAYPLSMPSDLTFGIGLDINDLGAVAGALGNALTEYGVVWNSTTSTPTSISSLVPSTFLYTIYSVDSIGNDFTMATEGVSSSNSSTNFFLGLSPR